MLIDTHAHLEMLGDVPLVIERAKVGGIEKIISISSDIASSERTVQIAESFDNVFAAVGIHPHEAITMNEGTAHKLEELAKSVKVIAIGETGLDYYYMHSPHDIQIDSFKKHIEIAKKTECALVVHVRDAHDDALAVLGENKGHDLPVVIHCYTGDYETALKYIDLGCYISFSGIVTFKNADDVREAAKGIPLDRVLLETDSPYLTPYPYRGRKNEPLYVKYVAERIAELRGIPVEKVKEETTRNAKSFFGI